MDEATINIMIIDSMVVAQKNRKRLVKVKQAPDEIYNSGPLILAHLTCFKVHTRLDQHLPITQGSDS